MSDELKPCPFCGEETVHVHDSYCAGNGFMVLCANCTAEGPLCNTEVEAATEWNRRAHPAPERSETPATGREARYIETVADALTGCSAKAQAAFGFLCARWESPVAAPELDVEAERHLAAIEEAAQVMESGAAHNESKGRTVLVHSQKGRAARLRAAHAYFAARRADLAPVSAAPDAEAHALIAECHAVQAVPFDLRQRLKAWLTKAPARQFAPVSADQAGAELWRALVRDTQAEPCAYPDLRDSLADWLSARGTA